MAHFADLTPYSYLSHPADDNPVNIGWLDREQGFPQGVVPDDVLARIFVLCGKPVNRTRGFHVCELCPQPNPIRGFHAVRDGIDLWLGSAEIRVPSRSGVVFACPNLIYHYIRDHQYKPPQEFIDAVMEISQSHGDGM